MISPMNTSSWTSPRSPSRGVITGMYPKPSTATKDVAFVGLCTHATGHDGCSRVGASVRGVAPPATPSNAIRVVPSR